MKYSILFSTFVAVAAVALISMTDAHATSPDASCVSGSIRNNFTSTWKGNDTISVKTRSGKPVCSNVTIYFSSYTLPDTYNGEKFVSNPTAYPQQQFDSKSFVIAKGENVSKSVSVNLPDSCTKYAQVDVYLGPEIKTVGAEGHQGRGIRGTNGNNHIIAKETCDTPITTVKQAEITEPTITELPKTGTESVWGLGLVAALLTAGSAYMLRR